MALLDIISGEQGFLNALAEQIEKTKEFDGWNHRFFSSAVNINTEWKKQKPDFAILDSSSFCCDEIKSFLEITVQDRAREIILLSDFVEEKIPALIEKMEKPVRLGKLISKVKFRHSLMRYKKNTVIKIGEWLFLPKDRLLINEKAEKEEILTDKEKDLLEFLCMNRNPVSKEEILSAVWGYGEGVDTHTLETHISRLRRKISSSDSGEFLLVKSGRCQINPVWLDK